jgi:hypothetical protein
MAPRGQRRDVEEASAVRVDSKSPLFPNKSVPNVQPDIQKTQNLCSTRCVLRSPLAGGGRRWSA